MSAGMHGLVMRIRNELPEIEHTLNRSIEGVHRAKKTEDDYYLDGVALNLHHFYSGIERLFELIASHVDGMLPKGENWHQLLLNQMSEEMADVRPAVISISVKSHLDEYRGFRHIVRNVYTYKFDPARIETLIYKAVPLFAQLKAELLAFAAFLDSYE